MEVIRVNVLFLRLDSFFLMMIVLFEGIIYNNQMDDFSQPGLSNYYGYAPSPANFIKPC